MTLPKLYLSVKASVLVGFLLLSGQLYAANILFVSDAENDENIPGVLTGDGHTVTTVINDYDNDTNEDNTVLQGDLSAYGCVVWSASGEGSGDEHNTTTTDNVSSYVSGGGTVFVTGYDSIASPLDQNLITLLGGSSSTDTSSSNIPGSVTGSNILSTGLFNIVGVTPTGGHSDSDTIIGLGGSAVCVADRASVNDGCQWSIRTIGSGQIAYVSNGDNGGIDHPSWDDTSAGGDGAYNAALRNFAFNCGAPVNPPPAVSPHAIPTLSTWAMLVLSGILVLLAGIVLRRRRMMG